MAKLFLKLWALILLTSLTSFQIQRYVFDWSAETAVASNSNERTRRTFVYVEEVLAPFPQDQWQVRFDQLRSKVGSSDTFLGPSRLTSIDQLAAEGRVSAEGIEKIRARQPFSLNTADGNGYELYRAMLDTDRVAVLKAPFARRQPILILGVFTSTQFTWLVESSLYAMALLIWLRLFHRDMLKLEGAAARVGEGKFDFEIDIGKGAALYPLADSLNKMKARISALIGSHKQLTNAISHEFRTPITRLRFRHELAMNARTLAEKEHELKAMDSAIDQLDELSTELLEYARLDREEPVLDVSTIDVQAWLEELAAEANDVAESSGRAVQVVPLTGTDSVDGDHRYLSRAAANLLRNAVRYAKSRVEISVNSINGRCVLMVDDDGPGIPLADREHLFEPFSRLDTSRDRASGGFGIGLAIVRQIARWHGGTVRIRDTPLEGHGCSLNGVVPR